MALSPADSKQCGPHSADLLYKSLVPNLLSPHCRVHTAAHPCLTLGRPVGLYPMPSSSLQAAVLSPAPGDLCSHPALFPSLFPSMQTRVSIQGKEQVWSLHLNEVLC